MWHMHRLFMKKIYVEKEISISQEDLACGSARNMKKRK